MTIITVRNDQVTSSSAEVKGLTVSALCRGDVKGMMELNPFTPEAGIDVREYIEFSKGRGAQLVLAAMETNAELMLEASQTPDLNDDVRATMYKDATCLRRICVIGNTGTAMEKQRFNLVLVLAMSLIDAKIDTKAWSVQCLGLKDIPEATVELLEKQLSAVAEELVKWNSYFPTI